MIANLDVNSINNKSDSISFMIKNNVVILFISETKLDVSFQSVQIKILALSILICMIGIHRVVILEMTFQLNS